MDQGNVVVEELVKQLNYKNRGERIAVFIWGVLINAFAFSVFFSPVNLVTGGSGGVSLLLKDMFGISSSITVFGISFVLLIIGYFLLGKYYALKTFLGVIILPIFIEFTSIFQRYIDISDMSLFLVVLLGGIIGGIGSGLIYKSGYSVGGFQTIYQILYKYFGISVSKSSLFINGVIVFAGGFFFGFGKSLYAIIALYVSAVATDRVMLETSASKTFYIITDRDKEISQYIVNNLGYGVTVVNARGGYSNDKKKMLMCAVPTRQYCLVKKVIQKLDEDVFFLITDTYEIYSSRKRLN